MDYIDGKDLVSKLRLFNQSYTVQIMPLVMASGVDVHMYMHMHICMKAISRNQVRAGLWPVCS